MQYIVLFFYKIPCNVLVLWDKNFVSYFIILIYVRRGKCFLVKLFHFSFFVIH